MLIHFSALRTTIIYRKLKHYYESIISARYSRRLTLRRILQSAMISHVVDIGANIGQFGVDLREVGYKGSIYSFEPIPEAFLLLQKRASRDHDWSCFESAIGESNTKKLLKISGNSGLSSSFLEMHPNHMVNFPSSKFVDQVEVTVRKLDDVVSNMDIDFSSTLMKIDAQGFEIEILKSFNHLKQIPLYLLEVSFKPLYEQSPIFGDIIIFFDRFGYDVEAIHPSLISKTGEILQADLLFRNRDYKFD